MSNRFIAFIPARGGSKSIPLKNIRLFCGRPLIYWALKAAQDLPEIDKIYVSTDDRRIADTVQELAFSKVRVVNRSPETTTDEASTESVMLEFAREQKFEHMILIQPTSPLIETWDLAAAIRTYRETQADSLFSGVWQKRFYWQTDGAFATPGNYAPGKRPRRQAWQGLLVENGAIYITHRKQLLASRCRLSGKIAYYTMPEYTYLEIDQPDDWMLAEYLKRKHGKWELSESELGGINLLVCDIDGVLTDAGLYYGSDLESRKFNTRDGMGLALVKELGICIMFLTSENNPSIAARARKLSVDFLHMGVKDKKSFLDAFFASHQEYSFQRTAYIGDDINDLYNIQAAGFSAAPQDAEVSVKSAAKYICEHSGGQGCVREVCDLIITRRKRAV